jgi:hypothetical protein
MPRVLEGGSRIRSAPFPIVWIADLLRAGAFCRHMWSSNEHRISLYTLPLDRFAFFRARPPACHLRRPPNDSICQRGQRAYQGVVTTKPLLIGAPFLEVNVEATSADDEVAVELLGPRCSGRDGVDTVEWSTIPGFSWVNISRADMLYRCVRWPADDAEDLRSLHGQTVRIRFELKGGAKLFAFRLSQTCNERQVPESSEWAPDFKLDDSD